MVEGKPSNRNTSSSTIWASTQRPNRKVSNYSDDKWINPQKWEETSKKGGKHPKPEHLAFYKGPKLLNSNGKSWTENDCDEMMELDFRRWIMRNFCELKEHVLNQCKETKNHEKRFEKRFEEMVTTMDNYRGI